jgi:hypothetical protein
MASVELSFINSPDSSLMLQIDPWANLYQIGTGEEFTIIAEVDSENVCVNIERLSASEWIVTLIGSDEFFVIQDGKRLHHLREFRTNVDRI